MLVLRRKSGESLTIAENVKLTILSVSKHGIVNVGIEAPREISIVRDDAKRKEQRKER